MASPENDDSNPRIQRNLYMEEVLQQQEQVVQQLRKARLANMVPAPQRSGVPMPAAPMGGGGPAAPAIDVRITGFWRFKTVVVPPNVYVVHTRRGHEEPLHVGLGVSFRYDPYTDAFLLIPAAMQTIVINARCICKQRQGILVQGYVQWIVEDVKTAYRKLDFSDLVDPMQVVNIQLREQAEAAIKDKVATLDIDDILADKQPIIEELTHRLRFVAEGKEGQGLGLKIVTVQIKESVVSSTRLWENLQAPFRAEQARIAELARIANEKEVLSEKLAHRKESELAELAVKQEIEARRHQQETVAYDLKYTEKTRQFRLEQEAAQARLKEETATRSVQEQQQLALELQKAEQQLKRHEVRRRELEALKLVEEAEAERQGLLQQRSLALSREQELARLELEKARLEVERIKKELENTISEARLQEKLIAQLPELAAKMPVPAKVEQVVIQGAGDPGGALSGLLAFLKSAWSLLARKEP
jgi:hypothetical protein